MTNTFNPRVCAALLCFAIAVPLPAFAQQTLVPETIVRPSIPNFRSEWMNASVYERQVLAEKIGEAGAKQFAYEKGWKPFLVQEDKAVRQGFDQVYQSGDGKIHVVEAKGGGSPLGKGYGHPQGTVEWAKGVADATLKNHTATSAEKQAAQKVLEAIEHGKLNVHVIRTEHVLGAPGIPTLESTKTTILARTQPTQTDKINPAPVKQAVPSVKGRMPTAAGTKDVVQIAGTAAKVATQAAVPVAVTFEVATRGYDVYQTEKEFGEGKISGQQRFENHSGNAVGCIGGVGGAYAGGQAGGTVGAAIGTCICPGIGTVIGGGVGTIAGGIGGYIYGNKAGEAAGRGAAKWWQ